MLEIQATLPTHMIVILTKFHKDRLKIVNFSLLAYFGACVIFFVTVSKNLIAFKVGDQSKHAFWVWL